MTTIYLCVGLAATGLISFGWLAPVIVVSYLRGALLTHELMHVCRPEQVTWILRMMMVFETPLGLGYREHQKIHLAHHRHTANARDPEFFQIRGGRVRAFLAAMLGPELTAAQWVRNHGISRSLAREASIRAGLMLALLVFAPDVFVAYWVLLRLTVGISNYMFHHVLHYRRGRYGTYTLRLPWPLDRGLRLVLGDTLASVLCEHDAHHAWTSVKPEKLAGLLDRFPARAPAEARP